jgi:hypothetical protein
MSGQCKRKGLNKKIEYLYWKVYWGELLPEVPKMPPWSHNLAVMYAATLLSSGSFGSGYLPVNTNSIAHGCPSVCLNTSQIGWLNITEFFFYP